MKKNVLKVLGIILIVYSCMSVTSINANALSSTQGAVISSPETNSEFGHVLYFPNSKSSKLNRYSLNRARRFYSFDEKATWTTLIPQEQPGAQKIEMNSFKMNLNFNGSAATKQDFLSHGIAFHFFVTKDGTNFTEMTDVMVPRDGYYQVPGEFIGYRYEMVKTDPKAVIEDAFDVEANCFVDVDLAQVTKDQLTGQTGLDSWLDSKAPNEAPSSNRQNIFAIQPTISGQVNYQKLAAETDTPIWESSKAIEGITIDLIEDTPTGDKLVASTSTDSNGGFTFSAIDGKNFVIDDTNDQLSIRVRPKSYKGWLVQDDVATADNLLVNVGRLTDIARQSGEYTFAESKTKWIAPFDEVLAAGKNATNNRFILTDFETTPSTTEPSTTQPSTTNPSTTEPSTTEPSTTEPSTTQPSTTQPSTTQPSTTQPSTTSGSSSGGLTETSHSDSSKKLPATGQQKSYLFISFGVVSFLLALGLLLSVKFKKIK